MADLATFVLTAMSAMDPDHGHARLAAAVTTVVAAERPLFAGDEAREKTAALIVAVAWREGSLRERVEGDCSKSRAGEPCKGTPHSFCTLQIHDTSGGDSSLNDDPEKCIRTGLAMLRTSMRVCSEFPLSFYAAGPRGFKSERAKRISRDRLALALRIRDRAHAALAASAEEPAQ